VERGTPQEQAEFTALSAKVSAKTASDVEKTRWRELRTRLAGPPPPPPPSLNGRNPPAPQRQHERSARKLRVGYVELRALPVTFTDEVSAGGLRIKVHHHVDPGALFALRLDLAGAQDPEPLNVVARVAWCKHEGGHYLAGLEFINLRSDERERLDAYAHSGDKPQ